MSDEEKKPMSKYAAKVAAQRKRAQEALAMIRRIEKGRDVQPKAKQTAKQQEPRGLVACLGDAPERCAKLCREAEAALNGALEAAKEMQGKAKRGRQMGEVISLIGIIGALPAKAAYAASRADRVPTGKAEDGGMKE